MTADRAAADTLRNELLALSVSSADGEQHWPLLTEHQVDAMLPAVRRYVDAQVAAERERIANEIEAMPDDFRWDYVREKAADIARGQP